MSFRTNRTTDLSKIGGILLHRYGEEGVLKGGYGPVKAGFGAAAALFWRPIWAQEVPRAVPVFCSMPQCRCTAFLPILIFVY